MDQRMWSKLIPAPKHRYIRDELAMYKKNDGNRVYSCTEYSTTTTPMTYPSKDTYNIGWLHSKRLSTTLPSSNTIPSSTTVLSSTTTMIYPSIDTDTMDWLCIERLSTTAPLSTTSIIYN